MKRAQDRLRLIDVELINRQPERRDPAVVQSIAYQSKKLLGVKIDRAENFRRRRFARDHVISLRTRLQKKSPVLHDRDRARVTKRVRVPRVAVFTRQRERFF